MWVSRKTDYATRAVLALALEGGGPLKLDEIARRTAVPLSVLEQVMPTIRTAGIARSERGPAGGYRLNKKPSEITLERIVRHCLEKSPEQRFHSAHDVAFALEALSGLSAPSRPDLAKPAAGLPTRLPSRRTAVALLALASIAIGLLAGWLLWKTPPQSHPTFQRLTFRRGPIPIS